MNKLFNHLAISFIRIVFLIAALATLSVQTLRPQSLVSRLFTTDRELPSSLVNDIVQDSDGNIWIATEVGLVCFNGAGFVPYLNSKDNPHSLCHNFVRCLGLDKEGHLLVGTIDGLQVFRPETQDFSLRARYADGAELRGNVAGLCLRSNGELWVCGNVSCCARVTADNEVQIYSNPLTGVIDLTQEIVDDPQGIGWLNQEYKEIYRVFPDGSTQRVTQRGPSGEEQGLEFSTLAVGLDGLLYAGGERPGLYRYDVKQEKFVLLSSPDATFVIRDIHPLYDGRMLLGTDGDGLMTYDYTTGTIASYDFDNANINSTDQKVHCIYVDSDETLWLGLFQRGVATLSRRMQVFNYYGSKSHFRDCIGDKCVTHVLRDADGRMWVSTDGGGIYCVDDEGHQLHAFPSTGNMGEVPTSVISIYEDSKRRFWVGSFHQGANLLDTRTGRCTPVPLADHSDVSNIYDFAEDEEGCLWCASMGNGLLCYDEQKRMLVQAPCSIATLWATCLFYDPLTRLLFVGSYNGLHVVDTRHPEKNAQQYIPESVINSISSYDAQNLLLATDMGVFLLDKSTRTATLLPTPDGVQNLLCYAALPDGKGNFWVSGSQGLACQNLSSGEITLFSVHDGLQGNEFYKNACWSDADGTLWFGGTMGLTFFHPWNMQKDETPFTVHVVGLHINSTFFSKRDTYNLDYEDNSFTITMGLHPLMMTYRGRYSYRMDGDEWVCLPDGVNQVSFNHLSSGRHTFYCRASFDGRRSEVTSVTICVGYPWYLSFWALLVEFSILALIGYLIFSLILHRRAVRNRLAEHVQAEAVKEAKLQFFMNISHELRTPMTLIVSPLQKLINSDPDPGRQHSYGLMQRNANRILMLINQLMDIRKMDKCQVSLLCQETEVAPFIHNILRNFDDILNLKHIRSSFVSDIPEGLRMWIDHDAIEKVMVNLVSNAIKYTPEGGNIDLCLRLDPEHPTKALQILLTDTGVGIPAEDKDHIFDRFYQVRTGASNVHLGTGIGLNLTHSLVQLHRGTIVVEDNPNTRGTRFIITLLLGSGHLRPEEMRAPDPGPESVPAVEPSEADITTVSIANAVLSETVASSESVKPNSRRQIMVVDDDLEISQYIQQELSSRYRVSLYHNGREALDALLRQAPDLVISDVMMPEMDGNTLCAKIRQNVRISHLPIILLTARDREEDRLSGLEIGADAYLTKPFSIDLLITTVQNLLRSHDRLRNTFSGHQLPVDRIKTPDSKSPDERLLERVNRIIASHIADTSLSAESVAHEVGLSRVHLYRKLKELTNQSARDYIRNIRLAKAAEILSQKKVAVAEVAQLVGFSNPSNFATSFKEVYGMTPTQYMEENRSKE